MGAIRSGAIALALLLTAPAAAQAGRVTYTAPFDGIVPPDCVGKCGGPYHLVIPESLRWSGTQEADVASATPGPAPVTLHDAGGVTIDQSAAGHCTQVDPQTVTCDRAFTELFGFGGDDDLTGTVVEGGPGDDHLTGTRLDGGGGDDRLTGTPGDDTFTGSDGADTIDGGAGHDVVDYRRHSDPSAFVIDLTGRSGKDRLTGIEEVFGARAFNVIHGTPGDDTIHGGGPFDQIDAGAGDDVIDLANGTVRAGAGADTVTFSDPRAGSLADLGDGDDVLRGAGWPLLARCGGGMDTVAGRLLLGSDCERGTPATPAPTAERGGLRVPAACPGPAYLGTGGACRITVVLRARGGRLLAAASRTARGSDGFDALHVRLRPGLRRSLARGHRRHATLVVQRTTTVDGVPSVQLARRAVVLGRRSA